MSENSPIFPTQSPDFAEPERVVNPARVEFARQKVLAWLQANDIAVETALFSGYSPAVEKQPDGEFAREGGRHEYYLGNAASMMPPSETEGEEAQGERWVVNPLVYALKAGSVLGIYDRNALAGAVLEADEEFGTYIVVGTSEDLARAQLGTLDFNT